MSRTTAKEDPITISEVASIAQRKLPSNVYDYYACGSDEQQALRRNVREFDRLLVRPRVMVDVSSVDTSTSLFGVKYPMPLGFAPSAMQRLVGENGESDVAAAANELGLNMTLSSQSTTSLEDVSRENDARPDSPDWWFQIYLTQDLERSLPLIKRAETAGYKALVVTVDTPVLGNRINERRTPLVLPSHLRLANFESASTPALKERKPTMNRLFMDARTLKDAQSIAAVAGPTMHSSSLTWETTLPWLRKVTNLKIILKGVMTAEDGRLAVEHGADAVVVSNHGGRQLDCAPSTIEALPEVAEAIAGRIPVIFDGGIHRGSDIFKAVALGAEFVLIGRPVLWGLSYKGKEGVQVVCNILEREFYRTMALAGVTDLSQITKASLAVARRDTFGLSRL
ncbi:hypothetical protein AAFC00_002377 [Neodothiora populina]|uniref:FMN hydroxy acid dehydrogenase domain-containing protein n=1 Tax=Neodothiora populina TaxID=2781224 RepID=A0ABR3PH84_9PEZI